MKPRYILSFFIVLKLSIHLIFNNEYGLHRDEFLYLAEGMHLGWGYMEGPPVIAVLARLIHLMGGSEVVVRLMPTLGGISIMLIMASVINELGGRSWALTIALTAYLVSPTFLRMNTLFQPVSFNILMWTATVWIIILIVKRQDPRFWYALGVVAGLGLMTKYSIVFLLLSLACGAAMFKEHRHWFRTKYPYAACAIAALIVLPNMWWQFTHNMPVLVHMRDLSQSQLANMRWTAFITDQFLYHLGASMIWVAGLVALLRTQTFKKYRFIAVSYMVLILLLVILRGKSYYSMGIYPVLFAFGGLAVEQWSKGSIKLYGVAVFLIVINLPVLPYALTVLPAEKMMDYGRFMRKHLGLHSPHRWENGRYYDMPQDYADMHGWEEMVVRVARVYHRLPEEEQKTCHIWGGSYGHAGAINYYRKKYDLPEAHSVNASFIIWCPLNNDFQSQILIDDVWNDRSQWFEEVVFIDSSEVNFVRDPSYIFYRTSPTVDIPSTWHSVISQEKQRFDFD